VRQASGFGAVCAHAHHDYTENENVSNQSEQRDWNRKAEKSNVRLRTGGHKGAASVCGAGKIYISAISYIYCTGNESADETEDQFGDLKA
jgi:hypothetical protein